MMSTVPTKEVLACSPKSQSTHPNRRGSKLSNPVVAAMLSSNNLSDCGQVRDMLNHCVENKSNAVICETAAMYFVRCLPGGARS